MKKILGTRFLYKAKKSNYVALILLAIMGLIFIVIPAINILPPPFIVFGILFLIVPIISYFCSIRRLQKQTEKVKDLPTIELSAPDTFTAYLFNGKVVNIKFSEIERIKSTHRTQISGGWAGFYTVSTYKDGTIKFILKDKTKVVVKFVNDVDLVADILIKLSRNPQATEELFNTDNKTEQA